MALHTWTSTLPNHRIVRPYKGTKKCPNCCQLYSTEVEVQTKHPEVDYDMCPYCGACNAVSKQVTFVNKKISQEDVI